MGLTLIHQPRGHADLPDVGTTWRTCVRAVTFVDRSAGDGRVPDGAITDEAAYAVLVEIVSGLRSPLLGETEVQAQFKAFLDSLDPVEQGWVRRLGQTVLADAKRIRARHLQHVGAHSYGRLAVRYVTASRVAVIGAGALARDVVACLDQQVQADVWSRRADAGASSWPRTCQLTTRLIQDARTDATRDGRPTSVIVAAPVSADDLQAILATYAHVAEVIDLRAEDEATPIDGARPSITLASLLADAEALAATKGVASVLAARREIGDLALAYARREELHPSGWDDLCA